MSPPRKAPSAPGASPGLASPRMTRSSIFRSSQHAAPVVRWEDARRRAWRMGRVTTWVLQLRPSVHTPKAVRRGARACKYLHAAPGQRAGGRVSLARRSNARAAAQRRAARVAGRVGGSVQFLRWPLNWGRPPHASALVTPTSWQVFFSAARYAAACCRRGHATRTTTPNTTTAARLPRCSLALAVSATAQVRGSSGRAEGLTR
eukprot:365516-Chlamydomonas_euryale.AAC.4